MYNFDLVKVMYNYKKFRKLQEGLDIEYKKDWSDKCIRIYIETRWIGYMNLEEDKIYRWISSSMAAGGKWISLEKVSDYA